jgi:transcriptional regulator with XRE-family HTH domain
MHDMPMTLKDYLKLHGLTDGDFARIVKRQRTTVMRWRKGERRPDWESLEAISEATGGKVSPNNFFPEQMGAE